MFIGLRTAVHSRSNALDDVNRLESQIARLEAEVAELRGTTVQLQADLQQERRLHRRVAELADVVEHALMLKLDGPDGSPAAGSVDDGRTP